MAFHDIRFPLDISLGARGGPQRLTDVVTLVSGAEERNQRWFASRRHYDARYGIKSRADMQTVLHFFEEQRGRFNSFRWRDALDHSTAANGAVDFDDVQIGVGDGAQTQFQLFKVYGASFDLYEREITKPVTSSVRIGVNGVELAQNQFSVNGLTGEVTLTVAPANGEAVTAGFEFDVPVRFDTDRLDIELTSFDAANIPSIPVIEVRE